MKALKQKVCSKMKCITNMKYLMENVKEKSLVSSHEYKLLVHTFIVVSKQLFENQVNNIRDSDIRIPIAIVMK